MTAIDTTPAPAPDPAPLRAGLGTDVPSVLFVCVKNGGKSQMAAALMRLHAGDAVEVRSAGTEPGSTLNAEAAAVVEQVGATFRGEHPKPILPGTLEQTDRVVIIGAEAQLPGTPDGVVVERWETDEPSLRGIEGLERLTLIRDELDERVRALLAELVPGG